jgi:hypothetical protein
VGAIGRRRLFDRGDRGGGLRGTSASRRLARAVTPSFLRDFHLPLRRLTQSRVSGLSLSLTLSPPLSLTLPCTGHLPHLDLNFGNRWIHSFLSFTLIRYCFFTSWKFVVSLTNRRDFLKPIRRLSLTTSKRTHAH